jgi:GxxExxY protein
MEASQLNSVTEAIIGAGIEVHRALGPGLLESTYEECLVAELDARGLRCERQVLLPLVYRGRVLSQSYRLDLIVEKHVIVEIKAVLRIEPVHQAQVLTYLRLSGLPLALLMNFHAPILAAGLRRYVNTVPRAP